MAWFRLTQAIAWADVNQIYVAMWRHQAKMSCDPFNHNLVMIAGTPFANIV